MDEVSLTEVDQEQQRARLEAMQLTMGEMGWRWFIAEVNQELRNSEILLRGVGTEIEVGRLQGRIDAFEQIIAFEDLVDNMLHQEDDDADL